ncbi:RNA-binding protein [Mucilaginibacter daejeonensis]|uniref:RNA recognition motif domain-containing protein n=1 Tax=Mucilaginibacter daejeonensis TaxID=398049 RepID=UPI001D1788DF|nr:RNA-binding protein [Mucilaginibacter daejeonensis]UEG54015.1 RNA-binding protein [Mucilaginibacter daejeonensis]
MVKLFVSGFPLEITEMELARMIGPHGDISTIKIVRDKQSRKCKGYAFVEMVTKEGADNAIDGLDGVEMEGRPLTVKISEDLPVTQTPNFGRAYAGSPKNYSSDQYKMNANRSKRPRRPIS